MFMHAWVVLWSQTGRGENLGLRKLHSEPVYLKIKPIHFPFHKHTPRLVAHSESGKLTQKTETLFGLHQSGLRREKRRKEYQVHLSTHTQFTQPETRFSFFWLLRKQPARNILMRVFVLRACFCGEASSLMSTQLFLFF